MKFNNVTSTSISKIDTLFADYFSRVYEKSLLSSDEVTMLSTLSSSNNHINTSYGLLILIKLMIIYFLWIRIHGQDPMVYHQYF